MNFHIINITNTTSDDLLTSKEFPLNFPIIYIPDYVK